MSGSRLHLNFSNSLISPNHSFIRCLEVHFMCTSKYTPGPEELNRNQWRQWWECLSSFDCERSCFHLLHLEIFLMSFYEIYTLVPTHRLVLCWQLTCTAGMCWHTWCDILALCVCIYCCLHFDVEAVFQYLNGCRPTNVQGGVFDIGFYFYLKSIHLLFHPQIF